MIGALKQAFREVTRRRAASLFTLIGILIGTASVLLLSAVGQSGSRQIAGELTDTGLLGLRISRREKSSRELMTEADLKAVRSLPEVKRAAPVMTAFATASAAGKAGDCVVWGTTSGNAQIFSVTLLEGRLLLPEEMEKDADVCLADRIFAETYYSRQNIVGKKIRISLNGREKFYRVVGVVSSGGAMTQGLLSSFVPAFVYLPYPAMAEQGSLPGFSDLAVELKPTGNRQQAIRRTAEELAEKTGRPGGYTLEDLQKKSGSVERILNTLSATLSVMGGLTLLVAGFSVFLMMQAAVRERRIEIGIQKALGATGGRIALQFLFESGLLAFFGGLAGLILARLLLAAARSVTGLTLTLSPAVLLLTLPAITLFGSLCGLVPALKAADCDPADAFRSL